MDIDKLLKEIDSIQLLNGEKDLIQKKDLIIAGLDYLKSLSYYDPDDMIELFKRVHWLGYEIGHNKGTETFASKYHKTLTYYCIEVIRNLPKIDKRMTRPFKDALVYEYDENKRRELEKEIESIESQS